jgi:hypothetical protein
MNLLTLLEKNSFFILSIPIDYFVEGITSQRSYVVLTHEWKMNFEMLILEP